MRSGCDCEFYCFHRTMHGLLYGLPFHQLVIFLVSCFASPKQRFFLVLSQNPKRQVVLDVQVLRYNASTPLTHRTLMTRFFFFPDVMKFRLVFVFGPNPLINQHFLKQCLGVILKVKFFGKAAILVSS